MHPPSLSQQTICVPSYKISVTFIKTDTSHFHALSVKLVL